MIIIDMTAEFDIWFLMYSCLGVHDLCLLLHPRVHRCHVSHSCGEEEQRGNGDYCEWLIMITMVIMIMGRAGGKWWISLSSFPHLALNLRDWIWFLWTGISHLKHWFPDSSTTSPTCNTDNLQVLQKNLIFNESDPGKSGLNSDHSDMSTHGVKARMSQVLISFLFRWRPWERSSFQYFSWLSTPSTGRLCSSNMLTTTNSDFNNSCIREIWINIDNHALLESS